MRTEHKNVTEPSRLKPRFLSLKFSIFFTLLTLSFFTSVNAQPHDKEPIAFIGHGLLFDHQGIRIEPSLEFLAHAQAWYQQALVAQLSTDKKKEYEQWERALFYTLDDTNIETLALKHQLLEWVFKHSTENPGAQNLIMKLRALDQNAKSLASGVKKNNYIYTDQEARARELLAQLNKVDNPDISILLATTNSGQDYIDECSNALVPIPPPINQMDATGLNGWRSEGFIPNSDNFLGGGPAELRSYRSLAPAGMCYSLPRFNNNALSSIGLDGVICMSETTSRVCFWDNVWTNPGTGIVEAFTIAPGEIVPIGVPTAPGGKYQAGGAELEFASGGECTDCHAGENPFIVHPGTGLLDAPAGNLIQDWEDLATPTGDLDHFSANRYVPLVGASWAQNEASMQSSAVPATCNACHVKGNAGRLPHLSNELPGYCGVVLPNARDTTMPPWAPGSEVAAVNNMRSAYCYAAPDASVADVGDPHITTVDGTRYDFQSAGEFTMLRALDDGFELQTRQSPVLTTFTPSANHHTGLASCPSLNTAVGIRAGKAIISYQPRESIFANKEDLQLFVNDKLIPKRDTIVLGGGYSLQYDGPGETLNVYLADGSTVRVEPKYWQSQGYWYLNIHVDNTRAREGVMGMITKGDWLPRLPDGTSLGAKPAALTDRHDVLNLKFADAWRVSSGNSLFYYPTGTSTKDFTDVDWPAPPGGTCENTSLPGEVPFVKEPRWDIAEKACSRIKDNVIRADCLLDVSIMGEADAAIVHMEADAAQ